MKMRSPQVTAIAGLGCFKVFNKANKSTTHSKGQSALNFAKFPSPSRVFQRETTYEGTFTSTKKIRLVGFLRGLRNFDLSVI